MSEMSRETSNSRVAELFTPVRDIPFRVILQPRALNIEEVLADVTSRNSGSCTPKHYLLGRRLEEAGFSIQYLTYPFLWKDLLVDYPNRLKDLAIKMPVQYHLCLESVSPSQGRQLIDATWDPLLGTVLPINDVSAGKMVNAVIPCEEPIIHDTSDQRWNFIQLKHQGSSPVDVSEFYQELNGWLDSIRRRPTNPTS